VIKRVGGGVVSVVLQATNELFLHVPKVAGGSISRSLLSRSDALRYAVTNMETAIPCVEQLQRHLPRPISSYSSVACVRNPWDWAVSGYLQVTKNMPAFQEAPSFREFMLGAWKLATKRVYPDKFTNALAYVGYHTQIQQWDHLGGRAGIETIDHICRFESLETDLADTSLPIDKLPHIHRSDRVHYSAYFDDELVDLVYRTNEDLIRTYGYRFEISRASSH